MSQHDRSIPRVHFAEKATVIETVEFSEIKEKRAGLSKADGVISMPRQPKSILRRVRFAEAPTPEFVPGSRRCDAPTSRGTAPGDETKAAIAVNSDTLPSVSSSSAQTLFEIDLSSGLTSPIPNPGRGPALDANVYLETVTLPRKNPPTLKGTVLVRNIAFEKTVLVRFTLDDWQTISEVICTYVVSLSRLPPSFLPDVWREAGSTTGKIANTGPVWDRFACVRLYPSFGTLH